MKFILKSTLVLLVLAVVIGAIAYGVLRVNVQQSGTISLPQESVSGETREISNAVDMVEMNGPFDLVIVQSDKATLTLEGEARLLPKVVIQQTGNVLQISTRGMLVTNNQTVKITVTLPKLIGLTQTGSGDCEVGGFSGPEMMFSMNGSGDLSYSGRYQHLVALNMGSGNMTLDAGSLDHLEITAGGSGDVTATGKARKLDVLVTGSGNVDAERLISQQAQLMAHGNSSVKVYANQAIEVVSTGGSEVEIYGNPVSKKITNTGVGTVSSN